MTRSTVALTALLACCLAGLLQASSSHAQQPATAATEPRPAAPRDIASGLSRAYPPAYDQAGAGGLVRVRMFVDTAGGADSLYVTSSTGFPELDHAALRVLQSAKYVPASDGTTRVGAWFELSLQFPSRIAAGDEPVVLNRDDVIAMASAGSPRELRTRRIAASIPLILTVDHEGRVTSQRSPDPGCFPSALAAAQGAARHLVFAPAGDASTKREVAATITFSDSVSLLVRGDAEPQSSARPRYRGGSEPGAHDRLPRLSNPETVRKALVRLYPQKLRAEGRGGTAVIRLHVDERGTVMARQVGTHSGYCELDLAALRVAETMRFAPARSDGKPEAVWVEIPIVFASH